MNKCCCVRVLMMVATIVAQPPRTWSLGKRSKIAVKHTQHICIWQRGNESINRDLYTRIMSIECLLETEKML